MASIGLPRRRYIGGPPPVCKKPPSPGPLLPPGFPRRTLQCFVHWIDYPPWPAYDEIALFTLDPAFPAVRYAGETGTPPDQLKATAVKNAGTETWNIQITSTRHDRMDLQATVANVPINPAGRFDSRLLHYWGDFHFYRAWFQITD